MILIAPYSIIDDMAMFQNAFQWFLEFPENIIFSIFCICFLHKSACSPLSGHRMNILANSKCPSGHSAGKCPSECLSELKKYLKNWHKDDSEYFPVEGPILHLCPINETGNPLLVLEVLTLFHSRLVLNLQSHTVSTSKVAVDGICINRLFTLSDRWSWSNKLFVLEGRGPIDTPRVRTPFFHTLHAGCAMYRYVRFDCICMLLYSLSQA